MIALKIIGVLLAGGGCVFGAMAWLISRIDCGDEIFGGISDGCFTASAIGFTLVFAVRYGHYLAMAY